MGLLFRLFAHLLGLLLLFAIALRLIGYESDGPLLAVYYGPPWPVLAAVSMALAVFWTFWRQWLLVPVFLLITIICIPVWLYGSRKSNSPQLVQNSVRMMFWNVGHPKMRMETIIDHVDSFGTDFIALTETGTLTEQRRAQWTTRFSKKHIEFLESGMLVISNGPVRVKDHGTLNSAGDFSLIEARLNNQVFDILLVDLDAHPDKSRAPAFERINALIEANADRPLLVMGDFNTPLNSKNFAGIRAKLKHAFETAGEGLSETWPVPVPVLGLDHIWYSPKIRVGRCQHRWTLVSDHLALEAEVAADGH